MRSAIRIMLFVAALLLLPAMASALHLEPFEEVPVPEANPQTPAKIELGKKLFFDRRLSGDGTMSCATCHDPERAFTDGLDISLHYPTTRNWRNSPTLLNVAFAKYYFHDGRVETLEDQALFPMLSAFEMNQNLDYLEEELRSVPEYAEAFREVFGGDVTRERVAMALAAFQRTLVSLNAPVDRYLKGDKEALSPAAKKGFEIFRGKGGCARCHSGDYFSDQKFHALGVPENKDYMEDPRVLATIRFVGKVYHYEDYRTLEEDPGRYLITKDRADWKAFRTPTLRNVSETAPYMHNGIFSSLAEVIEYYNRGGGEGNEELKPLGLTEQEKDALEAFLREGLKGEDVEIEYPEVP